MFVLKFEFYFIYIYDKFLLNKYEHFEIFILICKN